MMGLPLARHEIIRYWGAAILVAGLVAAALIYAFASEDRDLEAAAEIAGGRMYQHNLELMGGKLGVMLADVDDWFASLWHGTRLAATIAVLAIVVGGGCLWVASLMGPNGTDATRKN
ncbi:MAG TPA: hypothetical protein VMU79_15510 [Casimicrobiaceae bacterium]|nr:hypothetical protein [Casimicrobiaceae bacterium]